MQFAISTFNENKILLMKTKTICIASRAQEDNFEDTKDKTKFSKPSSFLLKQRLRQTHNQAHERNTNKSTGVDIEIIVH